MSTDPVPPQELRIGVGPFADPKLFLDSGVQTLELFRDRTGLLPQHSVLDVGCGCGRVALALRSFLADGDYVGLDPCEEYVDWCNTHIAAVDSRFRFIHLDTVAPRYNDASETSASQLQFPLLGSFDRCLFSSVIAARLFLVAYQIPRRALSLAGSWRGDNRTQQHRARQTHDSRRRCCQWKTSQ